MRRTPLQTLPLKGSPTDVAWQLGKKRSGSIGKRVEFWNREMSEYYRGRRDVLKKLEKSFLKEAAAAPQYLQEIHAMAEGAAIPFSDLFRLNLTELKVFAEKCTTLAFKVVSRESKVKSKLTSDQRVAPSDAVLIAHNEDWDAGRNDVFILDVQLPKVSYQIIAYDGYLPGLSCGRNSFGMIHAVNYLRPQDYRMGLPRIFITRHMVTTPSFADADRWIRGNKRAFGQSIHLAKGSRYINYELTAKKVYVRKPSLPTAHANHYLSNSPHPPLNEVAPLRGKLRGGESSNGARGRYTNINSLIRQSRADTLLQKIYGQKFTLAQAKKEARRILSDEQSPPYNLWRDAQFPEDDGVTLCATLLSTDGKGMEVFRKRPDLSQPVILV